jgi:hypothetical protein
LHAACRKRCKVARRTPLRFEISQTRKRKVVLFTHSSRRAAVHAGHIRHTGVSILALGNAAGSVAGYWLAQLIHGWLRTERAVALHILRLDLLKL